MNFVDSRMDKEGELFKTSIRCLRNCLNTRLEEVSQRRNKISTPETNFDCQSDLMNFVNEVMAV